MHEKRGLECRHFLDEEEHPTEIGECPTNKKSLINDNFDYPFSVQGNEEFSSGSRVGKSCDKGMAEIKKPILENLGKHIIALFYFSLFFSVILPEGRYISQVFHLNSFFLKFCFC